LPEHVDRHAAARIPVAADAQPARRDLLGQPLADHQRAFLVEGAVVAETAEEELQRLALDQLRARGVVDHQVGEVGLAGDGAQAGEFRRGEAHEIEVARPWIGHGLDHRLVGRARRGDRAAELGELGVFSHVLIIC
jgi:hypothetical protein